jgi:cell division protease FtsH
VGKGKNDWFDKGKGKRPGAPGPQNSPGGPGFFNPRTIRFSLIYVLVAIGVIWVFNSFKSPGNESIVDYSVFKAKIGSGEIQRVQISDPYYIGYTVRERPKPAPFPRSLQSPDKAAKTYLAVPVSLYDDTILKLMDDKGVVYYSEKQQNGALLNLLFYVGLPLLVFFIGWRFLMKRMGNMGGNVLSIGQNKAVIVAEGDTKTTFADVAGCDEAKDELIEVVDFLKTPRKYTDIGGKIPKGVLLVGPPGTGKTLMARAVAGEAGVPFFRMSGADFVEMFVGVGAARVRDLFAKAREKAPCIVFIDELDAIGKSRLTGMVGGNDEREQTLNQLLVEMDGFDSTTGLILLAATNRPDVLDPALLRPGRFDRQVLIDRPDLIGREAILRIHVRDLKLEDGVDLILVARQTPGFVGADLANVANEAALLAVRAGRKKVGQRDFSMAIEKAVAGLEKKNRVINPAERRVIAYHETGHALMAAITPGSDAVTKVSIVPRGFGALGYTLQMPLDDHYIVTEKELLGKIDVLLGGRAAEEIVFGEVSTGAANDITRATDIARRMITDYGMSARFRNVALTQRGAGSTMLGGPAEPSFQREYAESTQQYVDEEISRVIEERYRRAHESLQAKRALLDQVASVLLEKETIDEREFAALTGIEAPEELPALDPSGA